MKSLLIITIFSPAVMAAQMTGFGASYYDDKSSVTYHDTRKELVPEVIIGDRLFAMEFSRLEDIAKQTGAVVNHDNQASWFCLTSRNVNFWFISDNEMGQGDLTTIAIASEGTKKECSEYQGYLNVSVTGIPLLNASSDTLFSMFSSKPEGKINQYCNNSRRYGGFTQLNCLQYYRENSTIKGVMISQVTAS